MPTKGPRPWVRRSFCLGLGVLALLGASIAAVYSMHRVETVNAIDRRIIVRTDREAIAGARRFLEAAKVDTAGYDLAQMPNYSCDRFKGSLLWRVAWTPTSNSQGLNDLVVLVSEAGGCSATKMKTPTSGISVDGHLTDLSRITRSPFVLAPR